MRAYQFDDKGYYLQTIECQLDPRASASAGQEVYLLPGVSTFLQPLPEKAGFKVKFNGNAWEYEEIPTQPGPSPEELKDMKIQELKNKLEDSDYAIIKIAEGAATREEYQDLIEQRASWRAEINRLEAEE